MDRRLYVEHMNDEWRLQIDVEDAGRAGSIAKRLAASELEHRLSEAFEDRLIVSVDGARIFAYAGTREQAELAREAIARLAEENGWKAEIALAHWHPLAERWEDPDKPLPQDDAARLAEHEELIAVERSELAERGAPEFEVRVDLPGHREAAEFAKRLRGEGLPVLRRWKYLVIGAADEDAADELAARIGEEAPEGSAVAVEGSGQVAWEERPPNPFAVFGGLGG
jgi:hypothetical protein